MLDIREMETDRSVDPGIPVDSGVGDRLFRLMIGVFFGGGFLNSMVALLVPRLKLALALSYTQASSIQFAYYLSYLVFAVPAVVLTVRLGFLRAVSGGLALIATGCIAFAVAHSLRHFPSVLLSLFLLSSGVTILQIAGNAAMTASGTVEQVTPRFTLLQGFNAIGTVLGPLTGAYFLLGHDNGWSPNLPFVVSAVLFAILSLVFLANRNLLPRATAPAAPAFRRFPVLLGQPRMIGGIVAIFAYVGAEVTIGTLAVTYLMLPDRLAVTPLLAGRLVSLYWGGAMLGRFAGAAVLRRVSAPIVLGSVAAGAVLLVAGAMGLTGVPGCVAMLAIGLCNSVMFPIIYALAMPDRHEDFPIAAMLLCMAVVGGAIVPLLTGIVADAAGLVPSLAVAGLCYLLILAFAIGRRPPRAGAVA